MSQLPLAGLGKKLEGQNSPVISLFRVVVSLLFTCHGAATVLGLFTTERARPGVGEWPGWWAGAIQLVGGVVVLLGFGEITTRLAALACSGSMAYAYFTVHQKHGLWPIDNGGEMSVLFCWCFLLLAAIGPGTWTLTRLIPQPTPPTRTPHPTRPHADAETG